MCVCVCMELSWYRYKNIRILGRGITFTPSQCAASHPPAPSNSKLEQGKMKSLLFILALIVVAISPSEQVHIEQNSIYQLHQNWNMFFSKVGFYPYPLRESDLTVPVISPEWCPLGYVSLTNKKTLSK